MLQTLTRLPWEGPWGGGRPCGWTPEDLCGQGASLPDRMLSSQRRKDISPERVTHADREQTKKVVYSVVYGAGRCGWAGSLHRQEARRWGCLR